MNCRRTCYGILLVVLLMPISLAAEDKACNSVGPLRVCLDNITVKPYGNYIGDVSGSLEITNNGNEPFRIAMIEALSLRFDDGLLLRLHKFSGLADCRNQKLAVCERNSDEFEVIAPGQNIFVNCDFKTTGSIQLKEMKGSRFATISGSLFLRNLSTNKTWKANVSVQRIPLRLN